MEVTFEKPEVEKQIINLNIRNDIKEKLIKIYHELKNQIISNSIVSEKPGIGNNTSATCIKVFLANDLIEIVKGQGKGNYKFKQYF